MDTDSKSAKSDTSDNLEFESGKDFERDGVRVSTPVTTPNGNMIRVIMISETKGIITPIRPGRNDLAMLTVTIVSDGDGPSAPSAVAKASKSFWGKAWDVISAGVDAIIDVVSPNGGGGGGGGGTKGGCQVNITVTQGGSVKFDNFEMSCPR